FEITARHRDLVQVGREGSEAMPWQIHRISSNLNPKCWFSNFWGAVAAATCRARPRDRELCRVYLTAPGLHAIKDCFGATPKPAREPRALPRQPLAARVPFLN